jgi:TusA-related sulfurtransferase
MMHDPTQASSPNRLDLRGTKCPLNFVKARLAAEKLAVQEALELWLDAEGESALNIPNSLQQEGYTVTPLPPPEGVAGTLLLKVEKPAPSSVQERH